MPTILPQLEGVTDKLSTGAKVDMGCGSGGATLEMAKAYLRSEFHGYDSATVSSRAGQRAAGRFGLRNVTFHNVAAAELPADGSLDFVLTWDCLHDDPRARARGR